MTFEKIAQAAYADEIEKLAKRMNQEERSNLLSKLYKNYGDYKGKQSNISKTMPKRHKYAPLTGLAAGIGTGAMVAKALKKRIGLTSLIGATAGVVAGKVYKSRTPGGRKLIDNKIAYDESVSKIMKDAKKRLKAM